MGISLYDRGMGELTGKGVLIEGYIDKGILTRMC